jgi:hypothetical protein
VVIPSIVTFTFAITSPDHRLGWSPGVASICCVGMGR